MDLKSASSTPLNESLRSKLDRCNQKKLQRKLQKSINKEEPKFHYSVARIKYYKKEARSQPNYIINHPNNETSLLATNIREMDQHFAEISKLLTKYEITEVSENLNEKNIPKATNSSIKTLQNAKVSEIDHYFAKISQILTSTKFTETFGSIEIPENLKEL